ncbi:putative F-box/LRR-repeat protein 23 [Arachis duranensis]|nr:putative F-box/LRR-repeat protein 23 [Arachis duranensis]
MGCSLQQLRRLQLVNCDNTEILIKMAKGFPLLEELDITLCDIYKTSVTLKVIGQRCRRLKSLKFNMSGSKGNQDAYAIAQNMPNLRYLKLCRNNLDNNGLSAIFSGCPNLEYIDLGWCSNVDLDGSWLGQEYADKIVDLRYLHASMEDYWKMYDRGSHTCLMDYYYDMQFGEPWDERGILIDEIEDLILVSEDELKLEWKEEVDGICEIAILQRWHRSRNVNSFKEFRRYCQETKNRKSSNGKKHGRRAWKINYKSLYL